MAFRAVGTRSKVSTGDMTPGLPTGWAADDIHLLLVICQNGETAAASGYTQIFSVNNNNASQNTQGTLLWRRAVGGDAAPTVTGALSGSMCCIVGFSGRIAVGTPYAASPSSNATDVNQATINVNTITPNALTDDVVILGVTESEFASVTFSGYSGTDPTFTEAVDDTNTLGADFTNLWAAYGTTSGAAMGARTVTCSSGSGVHHIAFALSLMSAVAGQGAFVPPWRPHVGPNPARQGGWFAFMGSQYVPPAPEYLDPLIFGGAL